MLMMNTHRQYTSDNHDIKHILHTVSQLGFTLATMFHLSVLISTDQLVKYVLPDLPQRDHSGIYAWAILQIIIIIIT